MIRSPNHSSRGGRTVKWICIHTAEGSRTVESLGSYFASSASQVSSHVGIDDDRIEQYVDYSQESWTLRNGNAISENAELCGFAAWTREQWLNDHRRMLELTAQWIAERCRANGIPLVKLTPAQVAAGQPGVIGHWDYTLGTKDGSHVDPGPDWPWDVVMQMAAGPAPAPGMDARTLAAVMGDVPGVPYETYLGPFLAAMATADVTTVARAAMWCAQLGEESGGLRWMEEIADGSAYENRPDLGNTEPGDGRRFKGRGPIQLTGRGHYADFGAWCHTQGLVERDDYFVCDPTALAEPQWGFTAAAWYWTVARPTLNAVSDTGNVTAATYLVNGGLRGLEDRQARYARALSFGDRLLPTPEGDDMSSEDQARLRRIEELLNAIWCQLAGENAHPGQYTGWPTFPDGHDRYTLVDYVRHILEVLTRPATKP